MEYRSMQYREVDDDADTPEAVPADVERLLMAQASATMPFSALEEHVIELARGDGIATLTAPGALSRLVTLLFGLRPGRGPLADPRLEALRRAVVVTRHRHHLPDAQAAELQARGFTAGQIHALEARAVTG